MVGEFKNGLLTVKRFVEVGPNHAVGVFAKNFADGAAYNIRPTPRHHHRQAAVGVGIAPIWSDMSDMRGHHLGGEAGAGL